MRVLGALFTIMIAGCAALTGSSSNSSGPGPGEPPAVRAGEAVGWKYISASEGGKVQVPNGAVLEVPPGALDRDTVVSVYVPSPLLANGFYRLEPADTKFNKPVVLHVPLKKNASGKWPVFSAFHSSRLNPLLTGGKQNTNWKPAEVIAFDEGSGVAQLAIDHFTFIYVLNAIDQLGYLVIDMPFQYLEAGDTVFTLTDGDGTKKKPAWWPGHVGVLRSLPGAGAAGESFVMESTPPNGVQLGNATGFKTDYGHLYLGPRRPKGPLLTTPERTVLVSYLISMNGRGYNLLGEGNTDEDSFSCVGLAEGAHDAIKRSNVSAAAEAAALTPIEMFHAMRPVNELWARVDQPIDIPIYGVTIDTGSPYIFNSIRGWYQKNVNYSITAQDLPEGATFEGSPTSGYRFRWTPKREQGCESSSEAGKTCPDKPTRDHVIKLRMHGTPHATYLGARVALPEFDVEETLTVHVDTNQRLFDLRSANPLLKSTVSVSLELPPGRTVFGGLLRDEATLMPVEGTWSPYPGHTASIVSNTCGADSCSIQIEIKNEGAEPYTGPLKRYRYTADYLRERYLGR